MLWGGFHFLFLYSFLQYVFLNWKIRYFACWIWILYPLLLHLQKCETPKFEFVADTGCCWMEICCMVPRLDFLPENFRPLPLFPTWHDIPFTTWYPPKHTWYSLPPLHNLIFFPKRLSPPPQQKAGKGSESNKSATGWNNRRLAITSWIFPLHCLYQ